MFNLQRQETTPPESPPATEGAIPAASVEVILAGRYRIDRELGRGGFGAVYEALDLNLNRRCAVKENLDTSPDAFRQFGREANILANLSHPNLPRVTDHFSIPNKGQYLVMDYVDGEDLESLLKRVGKIAVDQALFWIFQVIDALEFLHDQPQAIIHRDIKPANIRITPRGKAVLVDFGLVKLYDPHIHTTLGARAVTPGFAPPEQYGIGKTDVRSDIYALGATLYTVLTGQEPLESVQRIQGEKQMLAHKIAPALSPSISHIIEQAMELNPAKRFQSATQFKEALQNALPGTLSVPESLVAPPPSIAAARATETASRPIGVSHPATGPRSKNRVLPAAGLAALAVLCLAIAAVGGSLVYYDSQAPARITQTVQGQQTLSAQLFATQTAQKQIISGRQATQTSSGVPISGAIANLPDWPEKFTDTFDGPSSKFWLGTDNSHAEFEYVSAALQNGAYHLELRGAKRSQAYWWTKSPELQTRENFILTMKGEVAAGAANALVGIVFHLDGPTGKFYLFGVNQGQEFGVWKLDGSDFSVLHGLEKNAAIRPGVNELMIWAQGNHYRFYINGSLVAEMSDDALAGGEAGLYYAVGDNVSATFNTENVLQRTP